MRRSLGIAVVHCFLLGICATSPLVSWSQQQPGARAVTATPGTSKPLTVDRIYSSRV